MQDQVERKKEGWAKETQVCVLLFTIARTWKQPKCPLTDGWIKKMCYIDPMEYYSAIKGKEIGLLVVMWMDLESVIQREVSQTEKYKCHMILLICGILKKWFK